MTMIFLAHPFLSSVASANPQQPKLKSFEAWCRQRKSVSIATRKTIEVLLKKADTKNCRLANRKLKTLTTVDLSNSNISDLKPLAGLTNLTSLYLINNQINVTLVVFFVFFRKGMSP